MNKPGFVYFMANRKHGAIYTGSTSNLVNRTYQHRNGLIDGFTKEHGCKLLVWFQAYEDLDEARLKELQIKKWKRDWKIKQIEDDNLGWRDLWFEIVK